MTGNEVISHSTTKLNYIVSPIWTDIHHVPHKTVNSIAKEKWYI